MTIAELANQMVETHPSATIFDREMLIRCIDACADCAQSCTQCADDCLAEVDVAELTKCIRLNLDCADICSTTGRVLARQTAPDWGAVASMLRTCDEACQACGDECETHAARMEHCRVCASECLRCAEACRQLLNAA